jgi:hypothetical protein
MRQDCNRVEEDASGLTFEGWDPTQNVYMSRAARGSLRTQGAGLQRHEDMVPKGLFCLWMMTLNAGHDVSEYCLFLH